MKFNSPEELVSHYRKFLYSNVRDATDFPLVKRLDESFIEFLEWLLFIEEVYPNTSWWLLGDLGEGMSFTSNRLELTIHVKKIKGELVLKWCANTKGRVELDMFACTSPFSGGNWQNRITHEMVSGFLG